MSKFWVSSKFESFLHRIQFLLEFWANWKSHTSAVTCHDIFYNLFELSKDPPVRVFMIPTIKTILISFLKLQAKIRFKSGRYFGPMAYPGGEIWSFISGLNEVWRSMYSGSEAYVKESTVLFSELYNRVFEWHFWTKCFGPVLSCSNAHFCCKTTLNYHFSRNRNLYSELNSDFIAKVINLILRRKFWLWRRLFWVNFRPSQYLRILESRNISLIKI